MKTIYFDTCIYNKLVDDKEMRDKIFYLRQNNLIEVIFSEYLFNEIVCAWSNSDKEKQKRVMELFQCTVKLISGKILKQSETIINEEIKAFLYNSDSQTVFLGQEQRDQMFHAMRRLANGEPITNTAPIMNESNNKKIKHKKLKDVISKHKPKQENISMSFEEFYASAKKEESEFIDKLLSGKILKEPNGNLIKKVEENINSLPYFRSYLRMNSAYQYSFYMYKKLSRGDDYDLRHFVCASSVDILVCDRDFLDILKWSYPLKDCFSLQNFLDARRAL